MKSMTGYGKREILWRGLTVSVEIRAVNHRFCEVVTKLPKPLGGLEDELKRLVHAKCERGRIELAVVANEASGRSKTLTLDHALARRYHRLLRELQRDLQLPGVVDLKLVSGFREVFSIGEPVVPQKAIKGVITRLTRGALTDLDGMRRQEGKALWADIAKRLKNLRVRLAAIRRRVPESVAMHMKRMQERVRQVLGGAAVTQDRLHQELAIYADRCDVTEELIRLDSHLTQFLRSVKARGGVGRRLDFLLQEMGREVNTIGSKANDPEIALHVVEMKSELEKIKEQVQNIE